MKTTKQVLSEYLFSLVSASSTHLSVASSSAILIISSQVLGIMHFSISFGLCEEHVRKQPLSAPGALPLDSAD